MGIYIYKLFSLNSKSKSGLEKMKTILISPVITSREMVQLTGEQRVFIVLSYTRTLSTTEVRKIWLHFLICTRRFSFFVWHKNG